MSVSGGRARGAVREEGAVERQGGRCTNPHHAMSASLRILFGAAMGATGGGDGAEGGATARARVGVGRDVSAGLGLGLGLAAAEVAVAMVAGIGVTMTSCERT